jgi:hypothetical protein
VKTLTIPGSRTKCARMVERRKQAVPSFTGADQDDLKALCEAELADREQRNAAGEPSAGSVSADGTISAAAC